MHFNSIHFIFTLGKIKNVRRIFQSAEKHIQLLKLIFPDIWYRYYCGRRIGVGRCGRIQSFHRRQNNGTTNSTYSCGNYRFHHSFLRMLRSDKGELQYVDCGKLKNQQDN